jgi:hypothetical protein
MPGSLLDRYHGRSLSRESNDTDSVVEQAYALVTPYLNREQADALVLVLLLIAVLLFAVRMWWRQVTADVARRRPGARRETAVTYSKLKSGRALKRA